MSSMNMSGFFFDQKSVNSVPGGNKSDSSGERFPYSYPVEDFMNIQTNNLGDQAWSLPTNKNCTLLFLVLKEKNTEEYHVLMFAGDYVKQIYKKSNTKKISSGNLADCLEINSATVKEMAKKVLESVKLKTEDENVDYMHGTTEEADDWIYQKAQKYNGNSLPIRRHREVIHES